MSDHNQQANGSCCCGRTWPCDTRKRQLIAEFTDHKTGGVRWYDLKARMAVHMADAAEAHRNIPAGYLFERYVGWMRDWPGYSGTYASKTRASP